MQGTTADTSCRRLSRRIKAEFIEFALAEGVLCFGEFTLKSGRLSPYFFHISKLFSGRMLQKLGYFYEQALKASELQPDCLFGAAYKGIPLATALAQTLAQDGDKAWDLPCIFNRKEAKGHGEGGQLIGEAQPGWQCLIVDDVLTAGTAVRGCLPLLAAAKLKPLGLLVALDREECAVQGAAQSARASLQERGLAVTSIVGVSDVVDYLRAHRPGSAELDRMFVYRKEYGVAASAH